MPDESDPTVRLRDITVRRGERTILDSIDLDLHAGQSTAIVGPSGSGKTTLLAVAAGLATPTSGTVSTIIPTGETGLILQNLGLVELLTVAENVEIALQSRPRQLSAREIRDRAHHALDSLGVADLRDRLVEQLSGGQRQRVAIARALAIRPQLLIADELTAQLDSHGRDVAVGEVTTLTRAGATVLIATHDHAVAAACDAVRELTIRNTEHAPATATAPTSAPAIGPASLDSPPT